MLGHDSRSYCLYRRRNRRLMQHCEEPSLIAPLNWGRPRIGAGCRRMALQIEYVDDPLPYHRASVRLFGGHRLGKRGRATVLGFDGALKFRCVNFDQSGQTFGASSASLACRALISSGPQSALVAVSDVVLNGLSLRKL